MNCMDQPIDLIRPAALCPHNVYLRGLLNRIFVLEEESKFCIRFEILHTVCFSCVNYSPVL